ncbi:putative F-box protein At4g10190 [Capsella rubella]|uniref:putative F-box protein At4g10190 n=1 Tax=Capsella rubella TaxID=81985 RepID=UPI000CD53323|nr:putative F-box protein At4g10190 [Capsella rubella]
MMKRKNIVVYLPEDLLVEILYRVPEASLARFRSTSKEWNALIKNNERLAKKSKIIMLIDFRVYLATIDVYDNNIVKLTSHLSLKDPRSTSAEEVIYSKYFTATANCYAQQMIIDWKSNYYALGKSSSNKYKILRIRQHGNVFEADIVEYEIYDFTSNSWRVVGETREWSIPWLKHCGISVNGNTYWLAFSHIQYSQKDILLSFDFSIERFEIVSLPVDNFSYFYTALSVTREEQKLCLLAMRDAGKGLSEFDVHVWMATKIESTGAITWRKFLTVKHSVYDRFLMFCNGMNFLADRENNILMCPGKQANSKSFLHIVGKDKHLEVDHHEAGSKCVVVCYVPTSAQIQQGS